MSKSGALHDRVAVDRRAESAFSLVELIVVLMIIGLLVSMLLPAGQRAREVAHRSQCVNNLKQLGIAANGYLETYQYWPAGTDLSVNAATPTLWDWRIQFLPYLGEQPLYLSLALDAGALDPANRNRLDQAFPGFQCPSDQKAGLLKSVAEGPLKGEWMALSYLGVSGPWGLIVDGEGTLLSPKSCATLEARFRVGTRQGMLYENSWVRGEDVKDGTSNTLLLGERGVPEGLDGGWLTGPGLGNACPGGWTDAVMPIDDNFGRSGFGAPSSKEQQAFRWWSHHPERVNFTFSDGSVRSLSYQIAPYVLSRLATRSGGEVVELQPDRDGHPARASD